MGNRARGGWLIVTLLLIGSPAAHAEDESEVYYRYIGPSGAPCS